MIEQPRLVYRRIEELRLVGSMTIYASHSEIVERVPEQWRTFLSSHSPPLSGPAYYGASPCSDDGKIHYLTGVVSAGREQPKGWERLTIPAGEYAVIEVNEAAKLREAWTWVLERWLPVSGRRERESPEFEKYSGISNAGLPVDTVEIWVPLEPIEAP